MTRIARFIGLVGLVALVFSAVGCDLITKPENRLFHVAVFNTSDRDVQVQNVDPDVSGQGGWVTLVNTTGIASFDWKERPHTLVFRTIVTHEIIRTVPGLEPNGVQQDRAYRDYDGLDAVYDFGTGGWQNSAVPAPTDR